MSKPYPHIIENIKDWPIYRVAKQKKLFKEKLKTQTFNLIQEKYEGKLKELIAHCAYSENNRIRRNPWKVDPVSEKSFWANISMQLAKGKLCDETELCKVILEKIISRYSEEITGGFKIETYKFSDKFLRYFFNRLFSSYFAGSIFNLFGRKKNLYEKFHVVGYVEEVRELIKKGTVVLVPTHQSNLDSILVGYFMHHIVGLPSFSYGAGLNLYNFEILAHFMNRLGAYKVDRRKKNAIYHETLFNFLKLSVQNKVNNLFFPAGGRVRDGKIETKLKTGLMSALIQAQKANCKFENNHKIFIVPLVLNYHFVLEAKQLINDYLSKRGREKFSKMRKRKSSSYFSAIPYIAGLISNKSEAVISLGKPLDVLGNFVNSEGESLDMKGQLLEISDYFKLDGEFTPDFQRESVYTKRLAENIAIAYRRETCVLCSQLVAFVAYQYLKKKYKATDIFDLLAYNPEELKFETDEILSHLGKLQIHIKAMAKRKEIMHSDRLNLETVALLQVGIKMLGTFHLKRPLKMYRDKTIECKDLKLLYYYANRLTGFGFEDILKS